MNSLQFNYISRLYSLIHINASNNIMVDNHVNILSPTLFLESLSMTSIIGMICTSLDKCSIDF